MTDDARDKVRTSGPEGSIRSSHGPNGTGDASSLEHALLTAGVVDAVRSLVGIMDGGGITRLDLVQGNLAIHLRSRVRGGRRRHDSARLDGETTSSTFDPNDVAGGTALPSATDDAPSVAGSHLVTSPMVGTYYASPSPGTAPFVEVGDLVQAGQTVGIVEAMKIMNEIAAEQGGIVTEVLAENGQPVEYGSPLLRLATGPGATATPTEGVGPNGYR